MAWPSVLLGLMAWSGLAGSRDAHFLNQEQTLLPVRRGNLLDGGRRLSEFTSVCPNIRRRSVPACGRCLSNEMCRYDQSTSTQWICSAYSKTCVNPNWDANQTSTYCPEQLSNYSAWSAMCKYTCTDQQAPFSCSGFCINEDFPCKWVPKCYATIHDDLTGMNPDSSACLRPCGDHDSMLAVTLKYSQMSDTIKTCAAAVAHYGCSNQNFKGGGGGVLEHCAHTCRTKECEWRCGRDELHSEDGSQCWQVVERTTNQYTCAQAISAGMDCHCKCAGAYLQLSRAGGGAFKSDSFLGDDPLQMNKSIIANESFSVSLTGQAMKTANVKDAEGPRMKLIAKGQSCRFSRLIIGMSGVECIAPPAGAASATTASTCITPPSQYSPYLHRWSGLKVDHCGTYDVCHCNSNCDLTKNWHNAGSVEFTPPTQYEVGSIGKAMPGCQRQVPPLAPVDKGPAVEQLVRTVTSFSFKIYGAIKQEHRKFAKHAAKSALVPVVKAHSGLLKREVPSADDVTVAHADRRLQESLFDLDTLVVIDQGQGRRLVNGSDGGTTPTPVIPGNVIPAPAPVGCEDDNAAFAAEAKKVDVLVNSCVELLDSIKDLSAMCLSSDLKPATEAGCRRMCGLCPDQTTSTTTMGVTLPPGLQDGPTMSFAFEITAHTDFSAANVLGRLKNLKKDPVPYIQRLFAELESTAMTAGDIPPLLWVSVSSEPTQVVIDTDAATDGEDSNAFSSTTNIIFVILAGAIGGSCVVGLLFVLIWYCGTRSGRRHQKVAPAPVVEVTQISDGGYRRKKVQVEGETPEQTPVEPDCLDRCLPWCYKRCCKKKLKKAKAFTNQSAWAPTDPSEITVGSVVTMCGLSSAHYNGLIGTIISGPNDKGRYEVDLIVVNDHSTEEHRNLSFKPVNMRLVEAAPASPQDTQPGSYRREGAGMRPEDWHPTSP